jgi:hypothetical protein
VPGIANPANTTKGGATLEAERIALVPSGTFGPYVGERPEGMVAAWAAEVAGKRKWLTVALKDGIKPYAAPKEVADAASDVDLVTVRPSSYGDTKGFIVLSSSREFSGEKVDAFTLGIHGELAGGPVVIAKSLADVVWIDAVQTATGSVAMWAVRRDDRADIFGVEVGPNADVRSQPGLLVPDARAWQVIQNAQGVAIATVTAGKARADKGPLTMNFIDAHARVERRPLVISDGATVDADVDIARVSDHLVVAWTDGRELEPRAFGALLDPRGSLLKPPAPLGQPFGPQAVLRIVPSVNKGPAFLVWENLIERPANGRAVRVARLSSDGLLDRTSALVTMSSSDGALPDFAATANGLAALTMSPACQKGRGCVGDHPVSTFVQLTDTMDVVAAEPLRLSSMNGIFVDLAWGLSCRTGDCIALAVAPANPAPVLAMKLGSVSQDWEAPVRKVNGAPAPRVGSVTALAKSDSVADIAAIRSATGSVVSWVTEFDPATPFTRTKTPAPDGKLEATRAVVSVQTVPDEGDRPDPFVVSYRAQSLGGVALAPGDAAKGETLIAWAGIDNQQPEVFLTLMGPGNKKIAQKMLTHTHGGVSDIAVVYTGDAWVIGFILEKNGVSEVHVARVDRSLNPLVADRRLGSAPAAVVSGVQLLSARAGQILAVWSDARGANPGVADIYAIRLNDKDLVPLAPEHVVAQTLGHSRSPTLSRLEDGAAVTWIEEGSAGTDHKYSAMIAQLDTLGEVVAGSVTTVALPGTARGLGTACGNGICRIVATVGAEDGGALYAFEWGRSAQIEPRRLIALGAVPGDTRPAVTGDDVFYADEARPRDARVRRLQVEWQ